MVNPPVKCKPSPASGPSKVIISGQRGVVEPSDAFGRVRSAFVYRLLILDSLPSPLLVHSG